MRIAILISGNGTTMEAVVKAVQSRKLRGITPAIVISSRPEAYGLKRAQNLAIQTAIVERKNFASGEEFGAQLLEILEKQEIELVSQNGWMPLTPVNVVKRYSGRIINQHPVPLDPGRELDFGGKGIFGSRAVCARIIYLLASGEEPWTEATEHHVTEEYDKGKLIKTTRMDIANLGPQTIISELRKYPQMLIEKTKEIYAQLFPIEYQNVIEALELFARYETVPGFRRAKPLVPPENEKILNQAKELAIKLFPQG